MNAFSWLEKQIEEKEQNIPFYKGEVIDSMRNEANKNKRV